MDDNYWEDNSPQEEIDQPQEQIAEQAQVTTPPVQEVQVQPQQEKPRFQKPEPSRVNQVIPPIEDAQLYNHYIQREYEKAKILDLPEETLNSYVQSQAYDRYLDQKANEERIKATAEYVEFSMMEPNAKIIVNKLMADQGKTLKQAKEIVDSMTNLMYKEQEAMYQQQMQQQQYQGGYMQPQFQGQPQYQQPSSLPQPQGGHVNYVATPQGQPQPSVPYAGNMIPTQGNVRPPRTREEQKIIGALFKGNPREKELWTSYESNKDKYDRAYQRRGQ